MAINLINPNFNLINTVKTVGANQSGSTGGTVANSGTGGVQDFSQVLENAITNLQSPPSAENTQTNTSGGTADLDAIFRKAADTYNVPLQFLKAVAKAESNFDPYAESGAGAQGIMQLMPGTARALGVTNAFDPEQNIMGGAKYLSQQLARYDGNQVLALAAYNAGPGNVAKYNGVPPFKETQNYIAKVMAYAGEPISAGNAVLSGRASAVSTDSLLQDSEAGLTAAALSGMDIKEIELYMNLYRYRMQLNALTDSGSDSDSDNNSLFSSLTSLV